jgi:hypothetical protein
MSLINNRLLLSFGCITLDFIVRILLSLNEWLNSSVSIERLISVIKGVRFDKRKSVKMSKWIIVSDHIDTYS